MRKEFSVPFRFVWEEQSHQWRHPYDLVGKAIARKQVGSHSDFAVSPPSDLRSHLVDKEIRTFKDALIDKPRIELEDRIHWLEMEIERLRSLLPGQLVAICPKIPYWGR